jgi:hypothetical protein
MYNFMTHIKISICAKVNLFEHNNWLMIEGKTQRNYEAFLKNCSNKSHLNI